MDKLEFKIEDIESDGEQINVANIFVNHKNLIEMLQEYELPFATKEGHPSIAGGYRAMTPESFLYSYLSKDLIEDGMRCILECSGCGEYGCWPMMISITDNGNSIKWDNFHQPHRGSDSSASFWDFKNFPSFEFSKENHESELSKLKNFKQ